MDKAILKKFAIESRYDLMEKMDNKIKSFYIYDKFSKNQNGDVYVLSNDKHTLSLTKEQYDKRETLIKRVNELGIEQVIEESAYTWFNRIIAIRYMEINNYLPLTKDNQSLGIRVLSSKDNIPDPEILLFTNLSNPELDIEFKKEKYADLKNDAEKFKYILLLLCKKLGRVIPQVFDGVTDYINILVPDNLLNDTGFVSKLLKEIPSEYFKEVEIIGWLYQYYISEKKDKAFNKLNKEHQKISKEDLPVVTQMFTPDWIVKLMVDNSLAITLQNNNIDSECKHIYSIEDKTNNKNIEKIEYCDLCCGSGHILVYVFDKLYEIYKIMGYENSQISEKILNNNLFGLDIDNRAVQLSCLSLIFNARKYDKNIFNKKINLNIYSICESNNISNNAIKYLKCNIEEIDDREIVDYIIDTYKNSKEYGSILKVKKYNFTKIKERIYELNNKNKNIFELSYYNELVDKFLPLLNQSIVLSKNYDYMITNPPYRGIREVDDLLAEYLKKEYQNSKYDLYSVFLQREYEMLNEDGYGAIIMPNTWLTIGSYGKFREEFLKNNRIETFFDFGPGVFGTDVGSIVKFISVIFRKSKNYTNYKVNYINYKEKGFINEKYNFDVKSLPDYKIDFTLTDKERECFNKGIFLDKVVQLAAGMFTSDNNRFLREWEEVNYYDINLDAISELDAENSHKKWFPYNKGGTFNKWFGNNGPIINYKNDGEEVKGYAKKLYKTYSRTIKNTKYFFKQSVTYTLISSKISARFCKNGFVFDTAGSSIFSDTDTQKIILAFLNSNVALRLLNAINNSYNKTVGDLKLLPILNYENNRERIINIVNENINLSKIDWDSNETSWNFVKHPLLMPYSKVSTIRDSLANYYSNIVNKNFAQLKNNEEELNKIFIDIYGLQDELTPEEEDKDVTIRKHDKLRDIKSFISYAVGCMFGRYSLDEDGLIYAGGEFDSSKYKTFKADVDNIIPITDEAYFADDIVDRFKKFVEVVYGKETLNENLDFIAETLGKKGTETSEETIRRYFLNDFYSDHIKTYQKRPIYWLFDSGKKNGFKALIYMHRYNENTIPKVRLDYLHRIQTTYDKLLSDANYRLTTDLSINDKKQAQNRQADLIAKLDEIKEYDEKIAHIANQRISIDLDDGVKVNYEKFKDILAKI